MLKQFRPTILFLARFTVLYLVLNVLYGWWVTSYNPEPDPATRVATQLSGKLLRIVGWDVVVADHSTRPRTYISWNDSRIVSVFEGCNGINVEIVFLTFLVAFGPWNRKLVWFAVVGSLIVYVANILRIVFLFWVTVKLPDYFYFVHKYLFTGSIYVIVFALWFWWVASISRSRT